MINSVVFPSYFPTIHGSIVIYLDVLLREKNVTRSASQLNITQPAMSNGLKRLRNLFNDPILVRTSDGMVPTERARALAPVIRKILLELEEALQGEEEFNEQMERVKDRRKALEEDYSKRRHKVDALRDELMRSIASKKEKGK